MIGLRIILLVALLSGWCMADDNAALASNVHQIFSAKCADCHGSHLPKPKGKFGYVLDLARVGKNPKFVTPGNAEGSEIYQMVLHNEMPGEDADVPPLTPDELKAVAAWIKAGCPPAPEGKSPQALPAPVKKERSFLDRSLAWLGKFHAASTHFPVGLLLAAVLAEAIAWFFKQESWLLVVRFLVVVSALSAPATTVFGWLAARYQSYSGLTTEIHRWMGVGTAVWAIVCAVLVCSSECREGSPERTRFRGALLLGALLAAITGFIGGVVQAGGDWGHYRW